MSDKKKIEEKSIYELLNADGQVDKIIDLFSEATDEELLPKHRQLIKDNVKTVTSRFEKMIIIFKEINDDPEKREAFRKEFERQKHKVPNTGNKEE